jgi:outer membrane receptor protein involved in Fe transport
MLQPASSRLLLAACLSGAALPAADPAVSVDVAVITATANANEVVSVPVTVTNTGAATLKLRLRDTGSGFNGSAVTPTVLAQYGSAGLPTTVNGIDFDGLVWCARSSGNKYQSAASMRACPPCPVAIHPDALRIPSS